MPYTSDKPQNTPPLDEVRERIPGWGVDLDYDDRPAVPMEQFDPGATGAHWDFPEQQGQRWPREMSVEHAHLTPVFGTSCPPKGLSGVLRRYAYDSFSEGQTALWLTLVAADRVDVFESRIESLLRGKPDNILAETGIKAEFTYNGVKARVGRNRADLKHQPLDAVIIAAPYVLGGYLAYRLARSVSRKLREDEGR